MVKPVKIPDVEQLSEESQHLIEAVNEELDLPCVLISASYLEQSLAALLSRFLIDGNTTRQLLDPVKGPLGSFSARSEICYSLGLIPKGLLQNLKHIGDIRNRFAHSHLKLTFADERIVQLCQELTLPTMSGNSSTFLESANQDPRHKYVVCVVLMSQQLLKIIRSTTKQEPRLRGWN